jgi:PAS domain S-box-containing protein
MKEGAQDPWIQDPPAALALLGAAGEALVSLDGQRRIRSASPAYGALLGVPQASLLGLPWKDLEVEAAAHGAQYRARHRRGDGSLMDVTVFSTPQGDGALLLVRARTEEASHIRTLEAGLRRTAWLLHNLGEGYGLVDEHEVFLFSNPAAETIFGVGKGGLLGVSLARFLEPDQLELMKAKTRERQQGVRDTYEVTIQRPDGERRTLLVTVTPDTQEGGRHFGTIGIFRDITDRLLVEQKNEALIEELRGALAQVRDLQGLLPICSHCKKIRDDQGAWSPLETYISHHSAAEFTHGICPECQGTHFPEMLQP